MTPKPGYVRRYERSRTAVRKTQQLVDAVFAGVWLGVLDRDRLADIDASYYDGEPVYHGDEHNLRGLHPWEREAIERSFPAEGAILVTSVGGGREAIGLRRLGYDVDAFDPQPALVDVANRMLAQEGFPANVVVAPPARTPPLERTYVGIVVGWGGYMLIQGRARRVAFLRELRAHVNAGAPILLSFFVRTRSDRYFDTVAAIANALRRARRREPVEAGDDLVTTFVHQFTRDELQSELADAGFRLDRYSTETNYGHAVALAC